MTETGPVEPTTPETDIVDAVEAELEGKPFVPFKINSISELKEFLMIARGQDPDSQQTINKFLNFEDEIERTNLPSITDVKRVSYFDFLSELFFPEYPDNPFKMAAKAQAKALMARKGEKSKQFVDMMKLTPSITDLQTVGESAQRNLIDRALGRGKE